MKPTLMSRMEKLVAKDLYTKKRERLLMNFNHKCDVLLHVVGLHIFQQFLSN